MDMDNPPHLPQFLPKPEEGSQTLVLTPSTCPHPSRAICPHDGSQQSFLLLQRAPYLRCPRL